MRQENLSLYWRLDWFSHTSKIPCEIPRGFAANLNKAIDILDGYTQ